MIAIVVTVIITSIIISVVLTQVFQQIWQIHSAQIRFDTILKTMTQMFLTFTVKLLRHIGWLCTKTNSSWRELQDTNWFTNMFTQCKADITWKFSRTKMLLAIIYRSSVLPPPLNLIPHPRAVVRLFRYITRCCRKQKVFHSSMALSHMLIIKCKQALPYLHIQMQTPHPSDTLIHAKTSFETNCFSAWASTLNMGLINKVDMVCLSPVGYGV